MSYSNDPGVLLPAECQRDYQYEIMTVTSAQPPPAAPDVCSQESRYLLLTSTKIIRSNQTFKFSYFVLSL